MKKTIVAVLCVVFALSSLTLADVKYVTTTKMEFEGAVGKMMKFMGGGKPIKTVEYYKDDVKRSDNFV